MPPTTESEFKLRAQQPIETATIDAALRELDVLCRSQSERRHTDTYLDDNRGSLLRAGIGLRLRAGGGKRVITCKTQRKDDGRLFVREELDSRWTAEQLPARATELPDELRAAVLPFVENRELVPQQTLEVRRETRLLTDGKQDLCELAIDFVDARANDHTVSFQEIELEVLHDVARNEELAGQLKQRLPVEFAKQDKPKYAAALLGIEAPIRQGAEELALQPAAQAIRAQLQQLHGEVIELEPAVRDVGHHRTVTDMHTAIERQEALLGAFSELWPDDARERMGAYLRTSRRHLGAVAELHTLLDGLREHAEQLPEQMHSARDAIMAATEQQRDLAMDRLSEWLSNPQRKKTTSEFEADMHTTTEPDKPETLLHAAPAAVADAAARLRTQLGETDAKRTVADAGALRGKLQSLLSLAEQFQDLPEANYKKSIKAVARSLRHTARFCDTEMTIGRLLEWIDAPPDGLDGRMHAAALGAFATRLTETAAESRTVAREVTERLDKKSVWRRFGVE